MMYGIFLALYVASCYVQWKKFSRGGNINHLMAFTTVFFGITITAYCILTNYRAMQAILFTPPGMTIYEYMDLPWPTLEVVRWAVFQFQIVVADVVMVYRMYHIYDRNPRVCIIPSITTVGLFVIACGLTNQLRDVSTPERLKAGSNWTTACFCVTIFNSIFTTFAITIRLWGVHRETAMGNIQIKDSVVLRVMKVLIESSALWTTFVALNFFAFLAKSNLAITFLAMTSPAVGISFCLIIVRLGQILPGSRNETWHVSVHTPSVRLPGTSPLAGSFASFAQIQVQPDVFVSRSKEYTTETLESQKQQYPEPLGGL